MGVELYCICAEVNLIGLQCNLKPSQTRLLSAIFHAYDSITVNGYHDTV